MEIFIRCVEALVSWWQGEKKPLVKLHKDILKSIGEKIDSYAEQAKQYWESDYGQESPSLKADILCGLKECHRQIDDLVLIDNGQKDEIHNAINELVRKASVADVGNIGLSWGCRISTEMLGKISTEMLEKTRPKILVDITEAAQKARACLVVPIIGRRNSFLWSCVRTCFQCNIRVSARRPLGRASAEEDKGSHTSDTGTPSKARQNK